MALLKVRESQRWVSRRGRASGPLNLRASRQFSNTSSMPHAYIDKNFMVWQQSMMDTKRMTDPGTKDLGAHDRSEELDVPARGLRTQRTRTTLNTP